MARWQKHLGTEGWNALYVENHDNPRINSILGNETSHSAKAIGTIALLCEEHRLFIKDRKSAWLIIRFNRLTS